MTLQIFVSGWPGWPGWLGCLAAAIPAQWNPPTADSVNAPSDDRLLTCAKSELAALRRAYDESSVIVTRRVREAEASLSRPVVFPPRGGQHNQWYQCDPCQFGLTTVDPTHHRCTRCKKVYSGEPYDDVIFSRVHHGNLARATNSAWAFRLTGENKFAEDTAKILIGYAERYEKYPYHLASRRKRGRSGGHLMEQTLTEASSMINRILPAFDLVRATLDAAARRKVIDHLLRPMLRNIAKHKAGRSNWQSFHNAAMFLGGALAGDAEFMRRAIFDSKHGFLFQMHASVSSEGMWFENSWGYHFYTLNALVSLAESARYCGIDLWGHPRLRKMFTLPAQYTMADGRLPRFGDDVNSSVSRARYLFETANSVLSKAEIRSALPSHPSWNSIRYGRSLERRAEPRRTSAVFRGAGHAILRTAGEGGLTAALTFGPFGGFHGHFDKLSFVWYGFANELGVDPGRARSQAYRLPIHKLWYRGTIAHNAVMVDGAPQQPAAGELLAFEQNDEFVAVVARCTKAYPGVVHTRCLVLTADYLVVLDRLASSAAHRFTWIYHDRGTTVACAQADAAPETPLGLSGEEFLDLQGSGTAAAEIVARFVGPKVTTTLRLAAGPGTQIHRGTGVGASVIDRVPLLIVERRGKIVEFAAILTPSTPEHPTAVTGISGGTSAVTVRAGARVDKITWSSANTIRVRRGR
jgi:Heparinase II/III-like protein/Alginate lyase